ncbi:MAG: electron transfer flavoprotein beta subunit/FixA family protein [Spirochaetes bacterium]|nr:MAG: electron transfer flavoprotein beta subunit/FixA family protein [Spirochaetota bacterium]
MSGKHTINRVVVTVKQVPDTTQVKVDPATGTLVREGIPFIVNPFDTHAVETALRMKDEYGCKVTAITMGPPNSIMTLRKCLAMGVDDAVLVSDRAFGGADTLATSYVLAEAIRRIQLEYGRVDVIICGKQTIDGDTAQVGPGIATRLGYSQLTLVDRIMRLDPVEKTITVRRKMEGLKEVVRSSMPALITVVREINKPRYPTVQDRLIAEEAEIPVWDNKFLKLRDDKLGMKGSPTNVKKIFAPTRAKGEMIGEEGASPREIARALIRKLIELDMVQAD